MNSCLQQSSYAKNRINIHRQHSDERCPQYVRQRGVSLIEILVTIAVTSIGLLGLTALQLRTLSVNVDSGNRAQSVWMVNDLINRIRLNPSATMDDYVTDGVLSCDDQPLVLPVCATYNTGVGRVESTSCNAQQLATSDLWQVLCGTPLAAATPDIINSNASLVTLPRLQITADTNAEGQDELIIAVSWSSRSQGLDDNGNPVYSDSENRSVARAGFSTNILFQGATE